MIIRIIGYLVIIVVVITIAINIVSKRPQWSVNVWKKILAYCVAFLVFIIVCRLFDILLNFLNIGF